MKHFRVVVKGLSKCNSLEMHINIQQELGNTGDLSIVTSFKMKPGYWVRALRYDIENKQMVGSLFKDAIMRVFARYINDETMVGYLDLPIDDFHVEVEQINVDLDVVDEYMKSCSEQKELEHKWRESLKRSDALLSQIYKMI